MAKSRSKNESLKSGTHSKVSKTSLDQIRNPSTGHYILRDTKTGKIISINRTGNSIKGVTVKESIIRSHPSISKSIGAKGEKAVISVSKKHATK